MQKKMKVIELARQDIFTCNVDASIQDVAREMIDKGVGSLVVIDAGGNPIGFVTDKAIFARIARGENPLDLELKDILEEIHLVKEDDHPLDVLEKMKEKDLNRVGIVSGTGKLVGIVSLKKLKYHQLQVLKEELGIKA